MRKNALVVCCVTCVFAAFGAFFRWLQLMTAFEPDTGLYIPGSLWGPLLTVSLLCCAAAVFVILRVMRKHDGRTVLPEDYSQAMRGTTVFYKPIYILMSVVLAAGAVLNALSAKPDSFPVFQYALSLTGLLATAGFLIVASAPKKRTEPNIICAGYSMLILHYCFWLVYSYRVHGSSPVMWNYGPEILAISLSLLAAYYLAGTAFSRPRPLTSIFFSQVAACMCIVALPDERCLGQQLMFSTTAVMLLFLSWMVMTNLREPRREEPEQSPGTAEENPGTGEAAAENSQ